MRFGNRTNVKGIGILFEIYTLTFGFVTCCEYVSFLAGVASLKAKVRRIRRNVDMIRKMNTPVTQTMKNISIQLIAPVKSTMGDEVSGRIEPASVRVFSAMIPGAKLV
jgi:hypothetical protein